MFKAHILGLIWRDRIRVVYLASMDYSIDEMRRLTGEALRDIRMDADVSQSDLAARTGKSSAAVSLAELTSGIESVFLMRNYERALSVPYGSILFRAGMIESPVDVPGAINASSILSRDAKFFLVKAYNMAVAASD